MVGSGSVQISRIHLQAMLVAISEFESKSLDIAEIEMISVLEKGEIYIVSFQPPISDPNYLGQPDSEYPELNVEVSKFSNELVRSYYTR